MEFRLNFDHFISKKMMTLIDYVFPKLDTAEDVVRQMFKKSRFRRPFNKRLDKRSHTLLKSEAQHLHNIY